MDDCLFKPISLSALSQWIKTVKPTGRRAVFSVQSLQALTGGDPSSNRRLLAELLSSSCSDRQELLDVAHGANRQALSEMAHKIKASPASSRRPR